MSELHDFGWAVNQLKAGRKVCRDIWPMVGIYIELYESPKPEYEPWIRMKNANGKFRPFTLTSGDILAEDWILAEDA